MNKRRTIYRGFNKRRRNKVPKVIAIIISVSLVGGYGYVKIKDNNIIKSIGEKFSITNIKKLITKANPIEEFKYNDISEEVDKINKTEIDEKQQQEDVKVATIDDWNIYTIQVASIQNDDEINKVEEQLTQNKIPFSIVELNGVKKVQTYGFFNKETTRNYLESTRENFEDAFLAQVEIPMLSLEYTDKYSYIENISIKLNEMVKNFEEESKFWTNIEKINLEEYNTILTKRKKIIEEIETEANKIDYEGANLFKENLIKYLKQSNENIDVASKSANEQNYHISEGLFLNSMQGYLEFINSIK